MFASMVTSRPWKTIHKRCIVMSTDFEHTKGLEDKNVNNFWIKTTEKETHAAEIVFKILD